VDAAIAQGGRGVVGQEVLRGGVVLQDRVEMRKRQAAGKRDSPGACTETMTDAGDPRSDAKRG